MFFAPMSNVKIENYFGGKVAPGNVESKEAVSSHCGRGGGGEETEKGKQVKQAQKLSDVHMHLYPQLNLNRRILLISITRLRDNWVSGFL